MCPTCGHEDMICDDFAQHMGTKHAVQLRSNDEIRAYIKSVGAFRKLSFCFECQWRNSSDSLMRDHKLAHELERKKADDRRRPAKTTPLVEQFVRAVKLDAAEREERKKCDDWDEVERNRPAPVLVKDVVAAQGATGGDDAASVSCFDDPDEHRLPYVPFFPNLQGDLLPASLGVQMPRLRVYLREVPSPGVYHVVDVTGKKRTRVDITIHYANPDKYSWPPRASRWNAKGFKLEATLLSTKTRPATALAILYVEDVPAKGSYRLVAHDGDIAYTTAIFFSDRALYSDTTTK